MYLYRALGRCVVPHAPVGLAGARPPLALAWPLASCFYQCVCGAAAAAAGWGRLQQQRPHRHAIISKKTSL